MGPDPAYGRFRPRLWLAGLDDRLHGRGARARARWGRLRPPPGRGPLVWLATGGAREDLRVATALMQALRETRADTRLVLTYQIEHPDLLEEGLRGLRDMGFGYGPCDARRAVRRALARLAPAAFVSVGEAPGPNLARALAAAHTPRVAYAGEHAPEGFFHLPRHRADPLTLLTPAQVEPTLRGLLGVEAAGGLWWWHGGVERELLRAWSAQGAPGLLALSGDVQDWERAAGALGLPVTPFSRWDRRRAPLPGGQVLVVDETRWLPALAVATDASHLARDERAVRWLALAAGRPLSFAGEPPEGLEAPRLRRPEAVLEAWRRWRASPLEARALGDAARRLFWDCRRRAQADLETLRQRYRDW